MDPKSRENKMAGPRCNKAEAPASALKKDGESNGRKKKPAGR